MYVLIKIAFTISPPQSDICKLLVLHNQQPKTPNETFVKLELATVAADCHGQR